MEKKIFVGLAAFGLLALMITTFFHLGNQRELSGSWVEYEKPELSMEAWLDGSYQTNLEKYVSANYSMHNFNIRIYNQVRYSAFHTANAAVIGKEGYIYESAYLVEALRTKKACILSDERIKSLAEKIYKIQEEAIKQEKAFVFVFTPSKADFESEYIPDTWLAKTAYCDEDERNYIRLKAEFDRLGVCYVDSCEILEQSDEYPVFYKSGIHWNRISAIQVVNAVSDVLEENYNISIKRLECSNVEISSTTNDLQDQDMYELLNVFWTPQDEVYYTVNEQPIYSENHDLPKLFIQGGSFTNKILEISSDNYLFAEVQGEFYAQSLQDYNRKTGVNTDDLNCDELNHAINYADVILLESNVENVHDLMPNMYEQILLHLQEGDRNIIKQPISLGIYGDEEDTAGFNWAATNVLYEVEIPDNGASLQVRLELPIEQLKEKYGTLDETIKLYANGRLVGEIDYSQAVCQISVDKEQLGLEEGEESIVLEIVSPYFFCPADSGSTDTRELAYKIRRIEVTGGEDGI